MASRCSFAGVVGTAVLLLVGSSFLSASHPSGSGQPTTGRHAVRSIPYSSLPSPVLKFLAQAGLPLSRPGRRSRQRAVLGAGAVAPQAIEEFIWRISVRNDGTEAEYAEFTAPTISADGRWVAFRAGHSSKLTDDDDNAEHDTYLYAVLDRRVMRVQLPIEQTPSAGSIHATISQSGDYVAMVTTSPFVDDGIYVYDIPHGHAELALQAPAHQGPSGIREPIVVSDDGNIIGFTPMYDYWVPDDTNGRSDILVYNRELHMLTRASLADDGTQPNADCYQLAMNATGRAVAFVTKADNLWPGDNNGAEDVFLFDMVGGGQFECISLRPGGGTSVGGAYQPSLSADARYVAFVTADPAIVGGPTDGYENVVVYDRLAHRFERISVGMNGTIPNGPSAGPAISPDGRYVAFWSTASNLVPFDTNRAADIFVYDRETGTTKRVSLCYTGVEASSGEWPDIDISGDGRYVVFSSTNGALVANDNNGGEDIFLVDVAKVPDKPVAPATTTVDIDHDGVVDRDDLNAFIDALVKFRNGDPSWNRDADLDQDGDVDVYDLIAFLNGYLYGQS